ncbi:MAG: hypothetical protein J7M25_15550 [Deltaproteobacteria bacterium]|nr:hypothetical protein [Deltaproteobacteria bacterium]
MSQRLFAEQAVVEFSEEGKRRLAEQMPHRSITICQDETFHPEPCLVAIEQVSNDILEEQYSTKRDVEAWTMACCWTYALASSTGCSKAAFSA